MKGWWVIVMIFRSAIAYLTIFYFKTYVFSRILRAKRVFCFLVSMSQTTPNEPLPSFAIILNDLRPIFCSLKFKASSIWICFRFQWFFLETLASGSFAVLNEGTLTYCWRKFSGSNRGRCGFPSCARAIGELKIGGFWLGSPVRLCSWILLLRLGSLRPGAGGKTSYFYYFVVGGQVQSFLVETVQFVGVAALLLEDEHHAFEVSVAGGAVQRCVSVHVF